MRRLSRGGRREAAAPFLLIIQFLFYMLFRDVKAGYPAYIFDRKAVEVKTGKVRNTPMPHFDSHFPGAGKMVVDLEVETGGEVMPFVMEESSEVGYVGDLVVTVTKDAVVREVERVKNQSEDALKMVDYHRKAVEKCDGLLKELSPEFRERTESAERMNALEGKVDKLARSLEAMLEKMEGGAR